MSEPVQSQAGAGAADAPAPETATPGTPTPETPTPETAAVASAPVDAGRPAIATWSAPQAAAPRQVRRSSRTGEPRRVWTIWIAAVAGYLATAVVAASTLWIYWNAASSASLVFDQARNEWVYSYDGARFGQASWLMGQFHTEPGSLGRVLLAVAVTAVAILIGIGCCITAYYAYDGRRWTRWSALVALAVSALALLLNPPAWAAIGLAAVMAVAVWLPPSARYFDAWQAERHHQPVFSAAVENVYYGPLPRYLAAASAPAGPAERPGAAAQAR
ncbi:MAG: hypothetical protein VB080_09150 [Propionicimonas sp.]|uniref:hypothetical protein n=1 Tax=Propionicimonas sp. TaxID=1955623 RepID=UPI002B21AECA|nr:hypothetical protein [Propionicimonas sp.]MEA4944589.1 hypothetical protein [Propionicimonas sp.]